MKYQFLLDAHLIHSIQLFAGSPENCPDSVREMLLSAVWQLRSDPGRYAVNPGRDFTRNRKIRLQDLLLMLLTMEADCLKEEIYRFFGRTTDAPSKAAFYKQRKKLRPDALKFVFLLFNRKLRKDLYNGKYQFIACDGSALDIPRDPLDPDTYFEPNGKSAKGFNQVYANAFYSILDRRFTDLVIQPGRRRNEYRAFCDMVDAAGSAGPATVYFGDMGYASYNNFAHVIENGQFFLIRCNDKKTGGILGRQLDGARELDLRVERILTRSQSKKKRLHPQRADDYRHICRDVPMDYLTDTLTEYHISLRVVRIEIAPGCFENIITNLPDLEFDISGFKDLYHLRWNEENSFRDLKYPLCLKAFHSKKYEYIVQEIWARAILHNFCSEIITNVGIEKRDTKHEYQANFSAGVKTCREFLRRCGGETVLDVEGLIAQNIEPVRPGRAYARQQRFKLPISFCCRN